MFITLTRFIINSLAYSFYMFNYSSFVMFANKINQQTSITSKCVEQKERKKERKKEKKKKTLHLQFNMHLMHAPDT